MKEIEIVKEVSETYYQCEVCKQSYWVPDQAEKCEKKHGCDHKEAFTDADSIGITRYCNHCHTQLDWVEFNGTDEQEKILKECFYKLKELEG